MVSGNRDWMEAQIRLAGLLFVSGPVHRSPFTVHPMQPVLTLHRLRGYLTSLCRFTPFQRLQQDSMKTFSATESDLKHDWHVVDASGVPLGRLASHVAQLIRGKHKPTFTPHMDGGDFVVVINASKVKLTGRKLTQKNYFSHSGYMGHERFTPAKVMMDRHPDRVIRKAVFGMLPKNSLSKQHLRGKLKVYAGAEHPHQAQQPEVSKVSA
jgi:large subunit ribosomal protein L13